MSTNFGNKPVRKMVAIGQSGVGKTKLAAALSRKSSSPLGSKPMSYESISAASTKVGEHAVRSTQIEYDSNTRHYVHVDCAGDDDVMKYLSAVDGKSTAAILVASAIDSLTEITVKQIKQCREVGISYIVVFLNKAELVGDPELLEQVEFNIRDELTAHKYHGENLPVVFGSAAMALADKDEGELGVSAVDKLIDILDTYIP